MWIGSTPLQLPLEVDGKAGRLTTHHYPKQYDHDQ